MRFLAVVRYERSEICALHVADFASINSEQIAVACPGDVSDFPFYSLQGGNTS